MNLPRRVLAMLALIPASFGATAGPPAATDQPGMTWDSIKQLPDFGGWWGVTLEAGAPGKAAPRPPPRPLKPEVLAHLRQIQAKIGAGVDPTEILGKRPVVFCGPRVFTGSNANFDDQFEFLFTPGRVTITSELGLIRRIPLNGPPLPAHPSETNSGTSRGHWEGRTLVIETTGIRHDYPYPEQGLGRGARIRERVSLEGPDVLQIVTRITAPAVYTRPYVSTTLYRRERAHVLQEMGFCGEHDRSVDEATGHERFDMTPPADLPPPPK